MSVIDGGSFKCYNHEELFETIDPQEWEAHINDGSHKESGTSACAVCGTPTTYENKTIGKKALCEKCKGDLLAE